MWTRTRVFHQIVVSGLPIELQIELPDLLYAFVIDLSIDFFTAKFAVRVTSEDLLQVCQSVKFIKLYYLVYINYYQ